MPWQWSWHPPGQYGASTCLVVLFRGFAWSHQYASAGNVLCAIFSQTAFNRGSSGKIITPFLSGLNWSNIISQYDVLKVLLKKIEQNSPNGCAKHFHTNKMANFVCYFEPIFKSQSTSIWMIWSMSNCLYIWLKEECNIFTRFWHQVGHPGYCMGLADTH